MKHDTYDVVVIGGGPAGSTVSTLIAQKGRRVGLFERERFPRFHIGADKNIVKGTTYYYQVRAAKGTEKGAVSPTVSATAR